ncbi:MAG: UDP-N-acetylmuramoyl-L-alanyl-D-glutamate--2,6-diaminopimelate ligase [Parachlamydia sp.]|nr:MAG: UDP-N-acetylmuramoyl-L-alanyl-D-glutamate--2,6-diaminopimelate ligase [Parachlamydia sp.]
MKLKKILKDIPILQVKGSKDIEITGICANSKLIAPGNIFVARRGSKYDGACYIPEAINHGAIAILTDIYDPSLKDVTQIICANINALEGQLSGNFYRMPSRELFTVGITGTNGKTTTSFLLKHLLDHIAGPCGLIGTIEYIIGRYRYKATHTTPDVHSNQQMLREMVHQGCHSAVMEVTSHALDQKRVEFIDYDVAVYTNLTQDHLDYHLDMEGYAEAKRKLFLGLETGSSNKKPAKFIVANQDCPWKAFILRDLKTPIFTYSLEKEADLRFIPLEFTAAGTSVNVLYQNQTTPAFFPLVGKFNLYNCMAALAVGLVRKVSLSTLLELARFFPPPPGRLQPIPNDLDLKIFVDFAHTDDALYNVLECLAQLKKGKIFTIFGCGGDRDRSKRPKMAKACAAFSDLSIVTSDNPRSEDPLSIIQEVIQGFGSNDRYHIEPNRYQAIAYAIDNAKPEDIILIAGKGHETTQAFAHQTVEFDDCQVAKEICHNKCLNPVGK